MTLTDVTGDPKLPASFVGGSQLILMTHASLSVFFRLGTMSVVPRAHFLAFFLYPDKRAFFIICTSELGPPQIYELVALTSSDKNM
jgi:hypothetical protein